MCHNQDSLTQCRFYFLQGLSFYLAIMARVCLPAWFGLKSQGGECQWITDYSFQLGCFQCPVQEELGDSCSSSLPLVFASDGGMVEFLPCKSRVKSIRSLIILNPSGMTGNILTSTSAHPEVGIVLEVGEMTDSACWNTNRGAWTVFKETCLSSLNSFSDTSCLSMA